MSAVGVIASCIGCGCDDFHACDGGCYWLRVDYLVRHELHTPRLHGNAVMIITTPALAVAFRLAATLPVRRHEWQPPGPESAKGRVDSDRRDALERRKQVRALVGPRAVTAGHRGTAALLAHDRLQPRACH